MPELTTRRLLLRAHTVDDYAASSAMWSDPIVARYIGGTPATPQQSWMRVLAYAGHWHLLGFGYWVIEERDTGEFIGELGFADYRRNIVDTMRNVPEIGWALAPKFHGQGFATEAATAAIAWADAHFSDPRTVCLIHPDNAVSIHVAQKCGYKNFSHAELPSGNVLLFERLRKTS